MEQTKKELLVFTNGCFDILHAGHVDVLERARAEAGPLGRVVVGLNSDESVRRAKGPSRPVVPVDERAAVLRAVRFVDQVVVFHEDTPLDLIESLRPDLIVKGGDYVAQDVVGAHIARVVLVPYREGISTTELIRRVRGDR